jgi:hypothetical protein
MRLIRRGVVPPNEITKQNNVSLSEIDIMICQTAYSGMSMRDMEKFIAEANKWDKRFKARSKGIKNHANDIHSTLMSIRKTVPTKPAITMH